MRLLSFPLVLPQAREVRGSAQFPGFRTCLWAIVMACWKQAWLLSSMALSASAKTARPSSSCPSFPYASASSPSHTELCSLDTVA